ncbi:hypothetical protein SCLCIDRAFT_32676 [Scleroderma citrinum Foug A]|uniref:Inhibitor I9 domain-containing protein n=1 Tax=Scleroderma citrinum Foug A TaxID=1036808 RepID=A0A0C3D7L1_9AGAM|nr:hypothetical protein SCLCIDRAFT_32676 [Scleroderma citrinum Foug A]
MTKFIVVAKDTEGAYARTIAAAREKGGIISDEFETLQMFSVEMSDADAKGLQGSLVSDILSFEPDKQVGSKALV